MERSPRPLAIAPKQALACAAVASVAVGLYACTLGFDLVSYDDVTLLERNRAYLVEPGNLIATFGHDGFAYMSDESGGLFYRPLLWVSFILEAQVAPGSNVLRHATNVVLHAITACGLLLVLRRLGSGLAASTMLALLFAAHPAAVPAVAWIPGRNDLLLGAFALGTTWALLSYLERERVGAALAVAVGVASCLFTKESGVGILPVALVLVAGRLGRDALHPTPARAALVGGTAAVTVAWLVMRQWALSGFPLFLSKVPANLAMGVVYVGKSIAPFSLATMPTVTPLGLVLGTASTALLLWLAWSSRARLIGPFGVGVVWYGVFLFPALLAPAPTRGLEHRLYVPLVGLAIALAHARWPERARLPAMASRAAAGALVGLFVLLSALRLPDYRGPIEFWEASVRGRPEATTYRWLAQRYLEAGRHEDALEAARRALAYDADDPTLRALVRAIEESRSR